MSKSILIIEDDEIAAETLEYYFTKKEYIVNVFNNGTDALEFLRKNSTDIILLDMVLPDYYGKELILKIRNLSDSPIIITTGVSESSEKIDSLHLGCDDYLVKPLNLEELQARITAFLRRSSKEEIKKKFNLSYDEEKKCFILNNEIIALTPKEKEVLKYLYDRKGVILNKDLIKTDLNFPNDSRTLDLHIINIRKKLLDDSKNPTHLKVIYRLGIQLVK